MKKYNNSLTNKITKLAFLFSVFLCFSCKNVLQHQDNFQSIPKGKAYLVINAGDITARTIKPDSDESLLTQFTSFTLTGTGKDAGNKSLSLTVSATDIKDLYNKQILLDAGTWTFTLKAFLGNSTFTATTSDVLIEEGKANSVSFNLQTNDTKGGLSVKINFDKTNVSKVNTTLTKLDDDNDDSNDEVIDSKSQTSFGYNYPSTGLPSGYITYERLSNSLMLEAGEYRLVFEFYWNDTEKLNTFQYIVHIAEGVRTSFVKTVDLNEVFKITYNGKSSSPTAYIANGQTLVEKYSRKSEDIILPRYNRQDRLFEGWYDEEGNIITKIPHNANKNYTVTCHWRDLKSGDPVTIYVNPEAEAHYGFSEEYGLESLEAAMETIERANCMNQNHDWIIKIKGEISGSHVISTDVNNVKEHVKSITLEGSTVSGAGQTEPQDCLKGGITTATDNGAVLSVQIPIPVIIKNLKITGGNNSNAGNIKGGGIYVGEGSTVTLDDGALITGNSAPAGSGVYVSSGATFQMGGGAQVAEGDDVYLPDGTKLLITKMFDGDILHAATITPETYSEGTQVLDIAPNGSGSLHEEYSVFTVTSQNEGGTTTNWAIDTDGKLYINTANESNLYVSSSATSDADGTASKPFASLADALAKIETLDDTSAEYTIIVDGEIKSAESTTIDITKATSLIITGKSGNATNSLDAQLTGVPLIINTAVPVTVKNIKITKGSPYGIQLISGKLTLDENTLISENITGVYISGGEVIMTDGEISENETGYGAGVYISYDDTNKTLGKFTMSGGAISGNKATYGCGGGVLVDGTLDVAPEELAEYTGGDGNGHVLFTMTNGTISENDESSTVTDDYDVGVGGGGVCVAGQYAKFVMSESAVIKANTATAYGAGVSVWNGAQFIMNGGTIGGSTESDGNIVGPETGTETEREISTYGGGVYLGGDESSSFTMNNGTISNNKSLGLGADPSMTNERNNCGGAGVSIFYGTFTMVNGNISRNTSNRHGGGIYIAGHGVFDMQGGSISENTCTDNGKGVNQNWTSSSGNTYKGQFKIKGDAVVASNNDVYLSDKLTITGSLNAANKVATLTPSYYDTSTIVLAIETEGGSVTLSDIGAPDKFLITPQVEDSVTTNWEIGSEGNLLKGSTTNNSGNGGIPEGFVTITGGTASTSTHIGTVENATDGEFTTLTIPDLWVSSELVTQYEYEQLMTYYGTVKENTSLVPGETSETAKMSTPAYFVTWLDAIVYCNLRSKAEGLTPVYSLSGNNEITAAGSPWTAGGHIAVDGNGKYYYNQTNLESHNDISTYDLEGGSFSYDLSANGYRLPTTAEYQNIKTKNPDLISGEYDEWCQNYYSDYKRCMYDASENTPVSDIYADTRENKLGFRVVRNAPANP